ANAVIVSVYDTLGHLMSQSDANGNVTTCGYDDDYRKTSVTDPLQNTVSSSYDENGNLMRTEDTRSGLVVTYTPYDALNRAVSMTQTVRRGGPGSGTDSYLTTYEYDDAANTVVTIDPNTHKTRALRDGLGRPIAVVADFGGLNLTTSYTYDVL